MLVTNTMEATASTTDSCQVSEPVTATQETPRTIATYTASSRREKLTINPTLWTSTKN